MTDIINIVHVQQSCDKDYLYNNEIILKVGRHSYIGSSTVINYESPHPIIKIGRFCSIAEDIKFILVRNHPYDFVTQYPISHLLLKNKIQAEQFYSKSSVINKKTLDITIENDVWIGRGATILPGVNIGNGAVIGAMSVVAKNVPPYAIAVGNPCKIIKYRFTADQIAKLLLIQWWLFDDEKIVAIADRLQSNNIDKFIEEFT